jgi:hypothetical protein
MGNIKPLERDPHSAVLATHRLVSSAHVSIVGEPFCVYLIVEQIGCALFEATTSPFTIARAERRCSGKSREEPSSCKSTRLAVVSRHEI